MERLEHADGTIAVVGMSCRFPRAGGIDAFWDLLLDNTDAVTRVPGDRFDLADYYCADAATPGRTVSRDGGFLDDAFSFDAPFFGISPVEARNTDPQQRILLHVVWEALEAAGIRPSSLAGTRAGVFVGQATAEYAETSRSPGGPGVGETTGSRLRAVTAGRISYALDLRGPSLVVDTACSSSLVAVHAARQSLLLGESSLAIAGGVNIILSPQDAIAYSQGGMLSPRGRCRFGDASADGFVRSEGVGAVVLKRLSEALRDGDPVLALLLGTAVTNDGRASGLLLQPSVSGQADMLREACRSAGITPAQLDYVEAHGTGTRVGDAVELRALAEAAADGRPPDRPLPTGSVKTNIGHTEAAAGIAGLIKAVLVARHSVVPASLHLDAPHPLLADGRLPVTVVTGNQPLAKAGPQALVGVSSFGLSGTNAHAVIGQFVPEGTPAEPAADGTGDAGDAEGGECRLLVVSARSRAALDRLALAYADHLGSAAGRRQALRDVCATAAMRRDAHPHRMWVTGATHDELAARLRALAAGERIAEGGAGEAGFAGPRRTVFVFPGQGSQWLGMGRGLLASSSAFRTGLLACDAAIRAELGWSVAELLTGDAPEFPAEVEKVQPALWAMQVALAAAWREAGVEPQVCVGHSMGEVAAACVSGALSLTDAAAVICRRSQLMKRAADTGGMLVVELSADQARAAAAGHAPAICVAAENAPASTVLAGDRAALDRLAAELEAKGVLCRLVKVNVASHSAHMDPLRDDLLSRLGGLTPTEPGIEMISTVRCGPVRGPELDAAYWMDNLRSPVLFADAVRKAASEAESVFVEVSPHPVLLAAIDENLAEPGLAGGSVPSLRRDADERTELIRSVGRLFAAGGRVDWERWYGGTVRPVPLPSYTWDLAEYRQARRTPSDVSERHMRRIDLSDWGAGTWGRGVRVHGLAPIPPVIHVVAILETAREAVPGAVFAVEDLRLGDELLDLARAEEVTLRVTVEHRHGSRTATVEAERSGSAKRVLCANAVLRRVEESGAVTAQEALDASLTRCHEYLSGDDFQRLARHRGYEIDEAFAAVEQLWCRDGEVVARMRRPGVSSPAAWESGLQPLLASWRTTGSAGGREPAYVPVSFGSVRVRDGLTDYFWSVGRFTADDGTGQARADVLLLAPDGHVLAEFREIRLRRLGRGERPRTPGMRIVPFPRTGAGLVPAAGRRGRTRDRPRISQVAGALGRQALRLIAPPAPRAPIPLTVRPDPRSRPSVLPLDTAVSGPGRAEHAGPEPAHPEPPYPSRPADADPGRAGHQVEALLFRAAAVLGLPVGSLDPRRPLRDFGLDSLMAAQLRQRLRAEVGIDVTAGRLLGPESVGSISRSLIAESLPA